MEEGHVGVDADCVWGLRSYCEGDEEIFVVIGGAWFEMG